LNIVPIRDVGVYHDSDVNLWHFGRIQDYAGLSFRYPDYFLKSDNLNNFLQSSYSIKFACYHVAFPVNDEWVERFFQTYSHVSHSFVVCSELHEFTVSQLFKLDLPNVSIFICGFINYEFKHAKINQWMDWFITTAHFYKKLYPDFLNTKLITNTNKTKLFDILLGCQRTHRDFIFDYINTNKLDSVSVMTYHRRWNLDLRQTEFITEIDGVDFLETDPQHTIHQIKYYGYRMALSQVVPLIIYNQTYYSVVAETNAFNSFNFYTEKIVKPILAGRIFIVIAGKGYLKNLRSLGFQTFSDIIDETYDDEDDDITRWNKAMNQVKFLSTLDPSDVCKKAQAITIHNQKIMLTNDWEGDFFNKLTAHVDAYLTSDHKVVG